jgi:hypothetical protein
MRCFIHFTMLTMTMLVATPFARADTDDDTLKFFLSKSELVVVGKITTEPFGLITEVGVPNYSCEFKIHEVLKGDAALKGQVIRINIKRFERTNKDKHPLIKKDSDCIVFLNSDRPNIPHWVTSDFWFGLQHPSESMMCSLKRLCNKE